MPDRKAIVDGQFYPASPEKLKSEISLYLRPNNPQKAIAVVSPHAGYIYSGHVAGFVYSKTIVPENVIILSPNHTGLGTQASIMTEGNWIIPTGKIPINTKLSNLILNKSKILEDDFVAHQNEHSLEVQLPFLKEVQPNLKIVPICISHITHNQIKDIGQSIADSIKEFGEDVLIVSSSDMNHYQNAELTKKKDMLAINEMIHLDELNLLKIVSENGITMCGVFPTAIAIFASKLLGAKKVELLKYANSGDINGDMSSVVGYAGLAIR